MPERARQIMDAAMELADEGGFEAVRLRDVAARADVALGTLYARFRSKEDILVAVLEQEAGKLETLLSQYPPTDPTPVARVNYYFSVATRALFARPNFGRAVLRAVAAGTPETASKVARYQDRLNRLIIEALHGPAGAPVGSPVPPEREEEVAFLLQQLWFAALVGWMSGIRHEEEILEQMQSATAIVLAGAGALQAAR